MRLIAAVIVLRVIDFNPRTPGGVRPPLEMLFAMSFNYFNPRTPGGVRQYDVSELHGDKINFNPRTPGGVRLVPSFRKALEALISIHAPRVGCDYHNP